MRRKFVVFYFTRWRITEMWLSLMKVCFRFFFSSWSVFLGLFSPASLASACRCSITAHTIWGQKLRPRSFAYREREQLSLGHERRQNSVVFRRRFALLLLAKRLSPALWLDPAFCRFLSLWRMNRSLSLRLSRRYGNHVYRYGRAGLFYSVFTLTDELRETHKPELFEWPHYACSWYWPYEITLSPICLWLNGVL